MQITKIQGLSKWDNELKKVRDCVLGSPFVKAERETYLPNPSNIPAGLKNAAEQIKAKKAYEDYLNRAEFDDFTGQTLRVMLGKMSLDKAIIKVPKPLDYLLASADGDGLSYRGLMENAFQNVAPAKWHVVLTEWIGASNLPDNPTKSDATRANMRVVFREYNRESVKDYNYEKINGVYQLSLLVLSQVSEDVEKTANGIKRVRREEDLILGLNAKGNYYQQLVVKSDGAENKSESTDEIEIKANGKPIKFIPVHFACDEEMTTGELPQEFGFLHPIADICLHRYNVSAKRKTALAKFDPTIFVEGITKDAFKDTAEMNGFEGFEMCGVNAIASNDDGSSAKVNMLMPSGALADYYEEDDRSMEKLRMTGASIDPKTRTNQTATQANIEASKQNSFLSPMAYSLERMTISLFLYAGMFHGLWDQDNLEQNAKKIKVSLSREFAQIKGTPDEVRAVIDLLSRQVATRTHVVQMLIDLGWHKGDAEKIIQEIETEPESSVLIP